MKSLTSSPSLAPARPGAERAPLIDLAKVLASQFIVWHHLAVYGPMSDVVHPYAPGLIDWLYSHARFAVQVFLVIGGYLAARSLWPLLSQPHGFSVPTLLWRRYLRLVRPYAVALFAAMAAAALARSWMDHPATPNVPTLPQLLAHLLLLQDVLGFEGLSAGVWYVAIDLQLFALLVALVWAVRLLGKRAPGRAAWLWPLGCAALTLVSLGWINRQSGWDAWAPYFFGSYGLGVWAYGCTVHRSDRPRERTTSARWAALALIAAVVVALGIEWRPRILVAGLTALMLVVGAHVTAWPRWLATPSLAGLARISYAQFLVHYPVCLSMNALLTAYWPDHVAMNLLGMLAAWLLSLVAAGFFFRHVEQGGWGSGRPPRAAVSGHRGHLAPR